MFIRLGLTCQAHRAAAYRPSCGNSTRTTIRPLCRSAETLTPPGQDELLAGGRALVMPALR